jgi:hypothetical protein
MKLFFAFAALIMFGSQVHAADSISFVIGGHRIHIEASRRCNSASCVSVSIPGNYQKHGRDRYDDDDRNVTGSAAPTVPVQASVIPPASRPTQPVACAPPRPIASAVPEVAPPPQQQPQIQPSPVQPPKTAAIPMPDRAARLQSLA